MGNFRDSLDPPDLTGLLFKNRVSSLFLLYGYLILWRKSEKTDESILRSYVAKEQTEPNSFDASVSTGVQLTNHIAKHYLNKNAYFLYAILLLENKRYLFTSN